MSTREPPRALRHLLRLFPQAHRRAYGEEMWDVVRHRYARAAEGAGTAGPEAGPPAGPPTGPHLGRRARLRLHIGTALDLVGSAFAMWMTTLGRGTMRWIMNRRGGWALDVRFVARSLQRSPGYALTAVLVLAGAVAVNAAVFGFVRGTLLAKPTYPGADRLVIIWGSAPAEGQRRDVVSGPNFIDFARGNTSLEAVAAMHADRAVLAGDAHPEVLQDNRVSVDFFRVVPIEAALGRVFDDRDRMSGGTETVVLSYAFWRDRLNADPSWVGRSLNIDYEPRTIIGVLPEDFEFILPFDMWLPLHDDALAADGRERIDYNVLGRMRPGVTAPDVTRDLSGVLRGITERTGTFRNWSVLAEPFQKLSVQAVRPILWTVSAAVALVLLIALVNLATLFRIRTLGRTDELGVRLALGGGTFRVARVLALEAVGLAVAGSVSGLLAALPLLARIRDLVPVWIPIPDSAARVPALRAVLDPGVAAVTAGLAVLGALVLTVPAFVAAIRRHHRFGGAAWGGRTRGVRGTRWLVAAELALATVLCLGAGLTTRSADKLLGTDVGLRDQGLLSLYVGDVWSKPYAEQAAYYRDVREAVAQIPGVTSAALIDYIPFQNEDDFEGWDFLDRSMQPTEHVREQWRRVSEGLFETAGMGIRTGRSFVSEDFQGPPRTMVVNESFAKKYFVGVDAVGRFLSAGNSRYRNLEIVGVVADVRASGPANPAPPMVYVPLQGEPRGTMGVYVRVASGPPMAMADAVQQSVWSVDASQPVLEFHAMGELVGAWVAIPRAVRTLISGLAALALLLAAVGVFGVVAYAVRSRTAELGVRIALGASPRRLSREVLFGAVPMVGLGVGAGLVVGALAARAARAALFGVQPLDPISLSVAVLAMAAVGLLATYVPARRVTRIDPTVAMRAE